MKQSLIAFAHGVVAWARRHRRLLIVLALLAIFFSVLGYFSKPVSAPGMCKIYG
ncbi:MAG: hypothetical protein ACYC5W_00185 [Thauera sp.]